MKETKLRKVGKQQAQENAASAWDKFENMVKVIVKAPKAKKRKVKNKPSKKPKRKGE